MKIILSLVVLVSTSAMANSFEIVKEDLSTNVYESTVEYPRLLETSEQANKINQLVRESVVEGCDTEEATEDRPFYHDAIAKVLTLEKDFITYQISGSSDCGGAHPNNFTYFLTVDKNKATVLDMYQEVPGQRFEDLTSWEAFKAELLQITLPYVVQTDNPCLENLTEDALKEELEMLGLGISGVGANNTIMVTTQPPHALMACWQAIEVPYEKVKTLIRPESPIHQWLK